MQQALTFSSLITPGVGGIERDKAARPSTSDTSFGSILAEADRPRAHKKMAAASPADADKATGDAPADLSDSAPPASDMPRAAGSPAVEAVGQRNDGGTADIAEEAGHGNAPGDSRAESLLPSSPGGGEAVPLKQEAVSAASLQSMLPPADSEAGDPSDTLKLSGAPGRGTAGTSGAVEGQRVSADAISMTPQERLPGASGAALKGMVDSARTGIRAGGIASRERLVPMRSDSDVLIRDGSAAGVEAMAELFQREISWDGAAESPDLPDMAAGGLERTAWGRAFDIGIGPAQAMRTFRPVATMLAERVAGASSGRLDVRLSPEELGKLQISFLQDETGLNVVIRADRPDTLDLLRRHISQFTQDLRDQGYEEVTIFFGADDGEMAEERSHPHSATFVETAGAPGEAVPASSLETVVNGGLDLRL